MRTQWEVVDSKDSMKKKENSKETADAKMRRILQEQGAIKKPGSKKK